jgi:hypothetical protein
MFIIWLKVKMAMAIRDTVLKNSYSGISVPAIVI